VEPFVEQREQLATFGRPEALGALLDHAAYRLGQRVLVLDGRPRIDRDAPQWGTRAIDRRGRVAQLDADRVGEERRAEAGQRRDEKVVRALARRGRRLLFGPRIGRNHRRHGGRRRFHLTKARGPEDSDRRYGDQASGGMLSKQARISGPTSVSRSRSAATSLSMPRRCAVTMSQARSS
jgi:hypothetical protein